MCGMSKWVFVTGGSGYIGSHVSAAIKDSTDYNVMLIDKRSMNLRHTTIFSDMFADEDFTSPISQAAIQDYKPKMLIHLAAKSTVGPSMTNPSDTWTENVVKMQKLLDFCVNSGVKNVIFASSSSVYKDQDFAVSEDCELQPISPYATTKLVGEMILKDWFGAHGINSISFRFFNVAGAHPIHDLGELNGATHLMAAVLESAVHGTPFTVFGKDWNTNDKTAIRDYTHVMDVADAIIKGMNWLPKNPGAHTFNLGGNNPRSVQQVIDTAEMLIGKNLPYRYGPRRAGDSEKRASDNGLAQRILGWKPSRDLNDMILDGLKWYNSQTYTALTHAGIRYE
jgi:UDP-glucose 4-epimerase